MNVNNKPKLLADMPGLEYDRGVGQRPDPTLDTGIMWGLGILVLVSFICAWIILKKLKKNG